MTGGRAYRGRSDKRFPPDVSKYPRHVPTLREQLEGSVARVDPDGLTHADVSDLTAKGVVANPLALRTHLEDAYEEETPRKRMEEWAATKDGEVGTYAHIWLGEAHDDTVYPRRARK